MVHRIYVEKKPAFRQEAASILEDIRSFLRITSLTGLRLLNRYDVEHISEETLAQVIPTVFSEPQLDDVLAELPEDGATVFATEYLPGQFDQRADSASQCIQLATSGERPTVRTAKVYLLYGELSASDLAAIEKYLMNPVESRVASLELPETLDIPTDIPTTVDTLTGFIDADADALKQMVVDYALAMDAADIQCCQDYFKSEHRDPTLTELRMLDTYWSDHCRHTTFQTAIDSIEFGSPEVQAAYERYQDIRLKMHRNKPVTLMDMATVAARYLKFTGKLTDEDESDEINACTVKVDVDVDGETEQWLLLFKNETHNHPTEIEPFGGAATCIGGAIRDPLSGRGYVYQAMRVTGAANPLRPVEETLAGKLPQRKLTTTAAAGYSSYGNQIGLATGIVDEIYHDGYAAKRMEIGAVVGAAPAKNVRREVPAPGDIVVLLGGRTGRDGCGGATGSSKSHNLSSLEKCGAEVQKGNAPEERKLQRLIRNPEATQLIKRCNDFGAGGVSVAIGELADGLTIDLNAVPKKYEGLDGTELAISESQERMAVVLAPEDVEKFIALAHGENLEATIVARVTEEKRLVMHWNGVKIVDIARSFIDSNGAQKHVKAQVPAMEPYTRILEDDTLQNRINNLATNLNVCSKRGLSERFDSTIGGNTVLMPFGGRYQRTPIQAMVAKLPVLYHETKTCSAMSWGYNPFIMEKNPYHGAYLAVIESVSKLVTTGAGIDNAHLTFQEYFEHLGTAPEKWGMPMSALLGAMDAQLQLGIASIGGKDSMSGTFEDLHVPPTLVSFAISTGNTDDIISPEFKDIDHRVCLLDPELDEHGLPTGESVRKNAALVTELIRQKKVVAAWTPTYGGVMEGVMKMCFGNHIGFAFATNMASMTAYGYRYGSYILEMADDTEVGMTLGFTTEDYEIFLNGETVDLAGVEQKYEGKLESVFPSNAHHDMKPVTSYSHEAVKRPTPAVKVARPRVLIPVFPGTNCEYDTADAIIKAGGEPNIVVINNLSGAAVADSVTRVAKAIDESQIVFLPGGFSGGDEPDGSAKFIAAFFRNPAISDAVEKLLNQRDGLMGGICNGFQALIKLGLVPYGKIITTDDTCPTLTFNAIGRHQSRLVRTRVASNKSPWLMKAEVGDILMMPISHGEGRFIASDDLIKKLAANGQIATQYCDPIGEPSMDITVNPNGSCAAIEGITSPDGRVFGKMGHSERWGDNLYKNVPGRNGSLIFDGAIEYFR